MSTKPRISQGRPSDALVAVVTGAARGIGQATARKLAAAGHRLVLCDIDDTALGHMTDTLGPGHRYVTADVTDAQTPKHLVTEAMHHYGRLDVWVNNAGILPTGKLTDQPRSQFDHTIAVNLTALCHGSQAALTTMYEQGSGHLINIASASAVKPMAGMAVYSATKAGVLALSEALRREARPHGIHVSTVLPALIDTRLAHGIRLPCRLTPQPPTAVADAVLELLKHPTSRRYVPRWLGWLLPWTGLLPTRLLDLADDLLRTDAIGCAPLPGQRSAYEAVLDSDAGGDARPVT